MTERVRPWDENPAYWQYRGEPVLLLGGTVDHNLFQLPNLGEHLDLLVSCGGNYIRNTMSAREPGNVWPFARVSDGGRYDLERADPEYWRRVDQLLAACHERGVVVQIELWDRFDFYREPWLNNPFNPVNNVNYSEAESGLTAEYPMHPGQNTNPFFVSVPEADDNAVLLSHQRRFVDWLLSASLGYDNVLYCMDNETSGAEAWGAYWSSYVREAARRTGVEVETTEMWDPWKLSEPRHGRTIDHPELYTFVEVSQNNHNTGQEHGDQLRATRDRLQRSGLVRPMNNVKVYGADGGRFGNDRDGKERFWRNIFSGCASARFHRPPSGLGLSPAAQSHLRSARLFADTVPVWYGEPRDDLLADRADNGAYCLAQPGSYCAVYLPTGTGVTYDTSVLGSADTTLRWLDIENAAWLDSRQAHSSGTRLRLSAPSSSHWIALLQPSR